MPNVGFWFPDSEPGQAAAGGRTEDNPQDQEAARNPGGGQGQVGEGIQGEVRPG